MPPEYRSWGVVPGEWFIDDTMRHLAREYYVGLLSAAAVHGAAHHAPQTFQVVVDQAIADRDLGRVRVRFTVDPGAAVAQTLTRNVPTGTVKVATPEQTAADLVAHPRLAGGWSNIATVLAELDGIDTNTLAQIMRARPVSQTRRLGWLLDTFTENPETDALDAIARRPTAPPTLLEPSRARNGDLDHRWALIVNTTVEPDL